MSLEPTAWVMQNADHPTFESSLHWQPQEHWHITWEAKPLYALTPEQVALLDGADELRNRAIEAQGMAECMVALREDLIREGVIDETVAPMFMTEAILRAVRRAQKAAEPECPAVAVAQEWLAAQPEAEREAWTITFSDERDFCRFASMLIGATFLDGRGALKRFADGSLLGEKTWGKVFAALAAPAQPEARKPMQVGCEGSDGLLRIHSETETCDVCTPADTPGRGAGGADFGSDVPLLREACVRRHGERAEHRQAVD